LVSRDQAKCEVAAADINQQVNNNSNRDTNGGAPKIRPSRAYAGTSTSLHKEQQIITLVEHVVTTFEALDLLMNNAGRQFAAPRPKMMRRVSRSLQAIHERQYYWRLRDCEYYH